MCSVAETGFALAMNFFSKRGVAMADSVYIHFAFHLPPSIPHCHFAGALHPLSPDAVQVLTCQNARCDGFGFAPP